MDGSLTPIDPWTGKPGRAVAVEDPYNMYFMPNGRSAIVVVENREQLDFRDPHTMALQWILWTPQCPGIKHGDFSIDGRYAIFSCEFKGGLVKIDLERRRVRSFLKLSRGGMPLDVRISPDGPRASRAHGLAPARPVLPGAHRQYALGVPDQRFPPSVYRRIFGTVALALHQK
jgi:hypothetical protein